MDIFWSIPNKVLIYTMPEILTLEDIQVVDQEFNAILNTCSETMHIIADNSHSKKIPLDLPKVIQAHTYVTHQKLGWLVNVKTPKFVQFAGAIMNQTFHTRYRFANTLEEAFLFLRENDDSLKSAEFKQNL